MDPIAKFLSDHKIPVGKWGQQFFTFLTDNFDAFFRGLSNKLNFLIDGLIDALLGLPPSLVVFFVTVLAWYLQRSRKLALGVAIALVYTINQGLWKQTIQTLVLVAVTSAGSMLIGVPLGIWAAHKKKVYQFMRPVLDLMQTLPAFVYLIPVMSLFGLRNAAGLILAIIFVVPTAIRFTHLGMTEISRPIMDAAQAFGATRRQMLWKVELPAALPTIMAGLTQCIMLALSMVVIAAMVGAAGLGTEVIRALSRRQIDTGLEAGFAIVALAIVLDRITRIRAGGSK